MARPLLNCKRIQNGWTSLTRYTTLTTMARKKPRRRKLVNATQSNDIPYSKYRIEWTDIMSDSGWATDKEFHRMKLAFPVNEGWLFSKDRYTIKMFASYDKDEDTKELTFGDRTMIPLACVRKMKKLN